MEESHGNPVLKGAFKEKSEIMRFLDLLPPSLLGRSRVDRLRRLFETAPAYACLDLFDATLCELRERIFAVGFETARKKAAETTLPQINHPLDMEDYPTRDLIDLVHAVGILTNTDWQEICRCRKIIQDIRQGNGKNEMREEAILFLCKACVTVLLNGEAILSAVGQPEKGDPAPTSLETVFESILDAMQEMIVYYDEELKVIWANRSAAEFAGQNREKMFGENFYSVTCQQPEPCEGCPVEKGLSSDYAEVIENNLFVGRLFFTRSLPVFRRGERMPGRLLVAQDISGLRNRFGVTDILNDISEIFHSPKPLSEMCGEVVKTIASKFEFPAGYITLYDEENREVVNLGEVDFSGKFLPLAKRLAPSRSFTAKVMQEGEIINVAGLSKMKEFAGYALKDAGAETVLAAPLNIEGKTIGGVVLIDYVERLESNLMVDGLQAVANRLGAEINRRQTEEKLKAERNFTMAVLNNAGPLIMVLDLEGHIVRFNRACEKLTGRSFQKAVGRPVWEFLSDPEEIDSIRKMFPLTWEKASGTSFENRWITGERQERLISWTNSIVGNPMEKSVHVVCIGIDITDRRRAEKEAELRRRQLLEADKMASLGVLASGVAHEINNPNNFIMMNAPILREAWTDISPILNRYFDEYGDFALANIPYSEIREEIPKLFDGIEDGSRRIRQIILNMKDYARKDTLDMGQNVDVSEMIKASLALLSHQIGKSTKSVMVHCPKDLPPVRGNRQRLEQVMVNLIQNACQSLPDREKGISIRASFEDKNGEVIVDVADEGTGIRPEHLEHIFDPFFTTKTETGGTGLGLSVCKSIVKEHGGRLEFTSEVGKGTNACLSLPAIRQGRPHDDFSIK
jgi:PAS domain S-box-containing protein